MRCNFKYRNSSKKNQTFFLVLIIVCSFYCDKAQNIKATNFSNSPNFFTSLVGNWHLIEDSDAVEDLTELQKIDSKEIFLPINGYRPKSKILGSSVWVWKTFFLKKIPDRVLGVYLERISSIDETYINNFLIGKTGSLSPRIDEPLDKTRAYLIPSHFMKKGENLIAIKIINPSYNISTGIHGKEIFIADYQTIFRKLSKKYVLSALFSLLALITGVYFLIFARNVFDIEAIKYFGLGCIFLAVYIAFYENLKYLFSDQTLALKKVEYSSLMIFPMLFLGYVFSLCQIRKNMLFKIILGIASSLFIIFLVPGVKSTQMFTILRFGQAYIAFTILFALYIFLRNYSTLNSKEIIYIMVGYLSLFLSGSSDILVDLGLLDAPKVFPLGALGYILMNSIFLNMKVNVLEVSRKRQISQFSELANYTFRDKNFKSLTKSCYDLIQDSLQYQFVTVEIISDKQKKYLIFSHDFLKKEIVLAKDKKNRSQEINVIEQTTLRNQIFCIRLYSLLNKKKDRGVLLISLKKDVVREQHEQLFRTLQTIICAGISHLDHRLQMKALNKSLEEKVKQRTMEVNEQFKRLQEIQSKQTTFFASITHDIKTPLSLITMPIENLLKKKEIFNETDRNSLYKIKYNIYRMIRMINSVLDMAKFELKELRIELISGDISKFIQRLSSLYLEIIRAHHLNLITNIDTREIFVLFDSEKIEKIMDNLINNAVKHSKPNETITIILHQIDKQFCEIRVKNQGKGLSEKEKNIIFRPFSQIYDIQGIHNLGSGLGLSISKKYVKMHGGTIHVESKKDRYTEFILRLPLHFKKENLEFNQPINKELYLTLQNREMSLAHEGLKHNKSEELPNKIFCVLLDKKENWEALIHELEEGFTLDIISDLLEVVKYSRDSYISIILIVNKLQTKYLKTIKDIKKDEAHQSIPLLILAQFGSEEVISQCIVEGAEFCLVEPIHPLEVNLKNQEFQREYYLRQEVFRKRVTENKLDQVNIRLAEETKIVTSNHLVKNNVGGDSRLLKSMVCRDQSKLYIVGELKNDFSFDRLEEYCLNLLISLCVGKSAQEIIPSEMIEHIQQIFPFVKEQKLFLCTGILSSDQKSFRYANASLTQAFFGEEILKDIRLKKTGPPIQKNKIGRWKNQFHKLN